MQVSGNALCALCLNKNYYLNIIALYKRIIYLFLLIGTNIYFVKSCIYVKVQFRIDPVQIKK